jgi:hypothetical protein
MPAVRLSFAARIRVHLGSCTDAGRDRVPPADFAIVRVACYRLGIIEPPRAYRASFEHELHRLLVIELDTRFLHFAIRQQPHKRFVVKIDNLNPITPGIAKVAAERRFQFQFVFLSEFLANFLQLRFVPNHDPEMPHVCALDVVDFENREELMVTQFEERIALAATHLFEIENILVKRHRLLNVIDLDGDMIASIDFHAHTSAYPK